jgi:hypothetical protein
VSTARVREGGGVVQDFDIARWRLRSQHLVSPFAASAGEVVGSLLAVQAENPTQAAWAVAARTRSPDQTELATLLDDGAVPRTRETAIGMALVDAQIVAAMRRTIANDHVEFDLRPYRALTPGEIEALDQAAGRYGNYLRLRARLTLP